MCNLSSQIKKSLVQPRLCHRIARFISAIILCFTPWTVASETIQAASWTFQSSKSFASLEIGFERKGSGASIRVADYKNAAHPESLNLISKDRALVWDKNDLVIQLQNPSQQFAVMIGSQSEDGLDRLRIFLQPAQSEFDLGGLSLTGRPSLSSLTGTAALRHFDQMVKEDNQAVESLEAQKALLLEILESSVSKDFK